MPRSFFALGPGAQHVVRSDIWRKNALPIESQEQNLLEVIQASRNDEDLQWFSFGMEGSWFAAWTEAGGMKKWKGAISDHYPQLYSWLMAVKSFNAQETIVVLGPDGSYWARSKGNGQQRFKIPRALKYQLDKHWQKKSFVALGMEGSFLYWNDDGHSHYYLPRQGGYGRASNWLQSRLRDGIQIVAATLSPVQAGVYFILLSSGESTMSVHEDLVPEVKKFVNSVQLSGPDSNVRLVEASTSTARPSQPRRR